jgi:putative Mg2+ transporter-C (MgtC) family protein
MDELTPGQIAARVCAALVCGALVGLERERKHRPAGFRTMILISLGSCGFMLLGIETVARVGIDTPAVLPPGSPIPGQAEMSRVVQGLMGGIGFLGAGAVIQNKKAVRGLTTAAAVWVVAALGAACAFGLFRLALMLGSATLFTLVILDIFENRFFPDPDDGLGWKHEKKNGKHRAPDHDAEGTEAVTVPDDAGIGPSRLRGDPYAENGNGNGNGNGHGHENGNGNGHPATVPFQPPQRIRPR